MDAAVKEYDSKIDSKKRIILRGAGYDYYHVKEFDNGTIVLEPRVLTTPFSVSEKTLAMMDASMENLKKGKSGSSIDLSAFKE